MAKVENYNFNIIMVAKDNDRELQCNGSYTHLGENFSLIDASQDPVLQIHESFSSSFEIEGEYFLCAPPNRPASFIAFIITYSKE